MNSSPAIVVPNKSVSLENLLYCTMEQWVVIKRPCRQHGAPDCSRKLKGPAAEKRQGPAIGQKGLPSGPTTLSLSASKGVTTEHRESGGPQVPVSAGKRELLMLVP